MNIKKAPIHIHHIGSHFTSAMFPAAALLLTIFHFTGERSLESASFYLVIFGTLAGPVVYSSGAYDWRTRFQGRRTMIFDRKLALGAVFIVLSVIIVAWRTVSPDVAAGPGAVKWVYTLLVYAATGAAGYLGHLGSKFI